MAKKSDGQQMETASINPETVGDISRLVVVVMLQCMAGMDRTLEVDAEVQVRPDVASAWVEAGIARMKGK
jgi:hypothetical protein